MKRIFCVLMLLASVQLIFGREGMARAAFDLVEKGRPACSIVVAESPTPAGNRSQVFVRVGARGPAGVGSGR